MSILINQGYTDYLIVDYQNTNKYIPSKFIYDTLDHLIWPLEVKPTILTLMMNNDFDELMRNYCRSRSLKIRYEPVQMLHSKSYKKAQRIRDVCTALTSDRYLLFNQAGLQFPAISFICKKYGLEMRLAQFEDYYT